MTHMNQDAFDLAFVSRETPTFAECLARIGDDPDLSPVRRRDLASGLRRLARALGRPLDRIPADPVWLRPRIARVSPAGLGLSLKSWVNVISDARAALDHCGIVARRKRSLKDLSPLWSGLWSAVRESGDQSLQPGLGRFVRFLDSLGVAPEDVSEAHVAGFERALEVNELRRDPANAARHAVFAWNCATKRLTAWPKHRLEVPSRSRRYALRLDAFPESFVADIARYVRRLECPDPLDPDALAAPLRPATVRHRRAQVIRFASAIVHAGVPVEEITALGSLLEPEKMRSGLQWMLARNDDQRSAGIADIVVMLKSVGRYHVRSSDEELSDLKRLAGHLALPARSGLTTQNRERLRQFDDPRNLRKLLGLPERLAERARGMGAGHRGCLQFETAVAIAILRHCPIRRTNLAELRLDQNLRRTIGGRAYLVFFPSNVKNSRQIEFELPPALIDLIDEHVARRAGVLCPEETPWLFPRRDGLAPIEKSGFSTRISKTIRKETGLEVNLHFFRHLSAKIFLDANPGQYEVVRRILGHAELSSTLNAYAEFEAGTATRMFAEIIDRARGADT